MRRLKVSLATHLDGGHHARLDQEVGVQGLRDELCCRRRLGPLVDVLYEQRRGYVAARTAVGEKAYVWFNALRLLPRL